MWWLCFERNGATVCVVIMNGESLPAARIRAAIAGLGNPDEFANGHLLDDRCAALLTRRDVCCELSPNQANALLHRIETGLRKPPAPSLRRRRITQSA